LHSAAAVRSRFRPLLLVVLAGLPATAGGCVEAVVDSDCFDTVDDSYTVTTPADPPLQFAIESCRVDRDACTMLCEEAMARHNVSSQPSVCKVEFHDASVSIDVRYEIRRGGSDCGIEDVPPFEMPPTRFSLVEPAGFSDGPQVRGHSARAFDPDWDPSWNGGRPCHA
jgi:hypothetical protein